MGTNFYRRKKRSSFNKELASHYITVEKIFGSTDSLESMLDEYNEKVHICKRSWGWQICFDHNWGLHYQPNKESLSKFLEDENYEIVDEDGEVLTTEDFWDMVKCHNSNPQCYHTSEIYEKEEREKNRYYHNYVIECKEDRRRVLETFGIETQFNDFEVDGLRWAVYSDFS